jgi:hypothetical protein
MTRPDSPISGTEFASDDVKAEIEQLAYLGLRMGFGKSYPRRLIRQFAHSCLENKLSFAKAWMARGPFPPLRYCGLGNLRRAASRRRGVVIAACHVGQYHRIPLVLNKLGYAVTLLLDGENQAREEQELDGWISRYNGPLERPIEYLNAEVPTAPWRMSGCGTTWKTAPTSRASRVIRPTKSWTRRPRTSRPSPKFWAKIGIFSGPTGRRLLTRSSSE